MNDIFESVEKPLKMSFRALARNLRQGKNRVRTRFFTEFTLNEVNVFRMTKIGFSTLSDYKN